MSRGGDRPASAASLTEAGSSLVRHHKPLAGAPPPLPALRRIDGMYEWLREARRAAANAPPEAAKAAEWLLDNDYQVQRAIRQVEADLPDSFYRRLPAAETGCWSGARAFAIAHGLLRASRLQLSLVGAIDFVRGYQCAEPLTIGELWALPAMLRLGCLELLAASFAEQFPSVRLPFDPSAFATAETSFDATERVARAIGNLALISSVPWEEFFEASSLVEAVLREDPARSYAGMDFETRDSYRRAVEEIATWGGRRETDVAAAAVACAKTAAPAPEGEAVDHVGHWLRGPGREEFERSLCVAPPRGKRLARAFFRRAAFFYGGSLFACTTLALLGPAAYLWGVGASLTTWIVCMAATLLPASILSHTIVQWVLTRRLSPRVLPKMDFRTGIPLDCRTLVVMPVLVGSAGDVPDLIAQIEAHRLANPDPALRFALLSDLPDSDSERRESDTPVEEALAKGIEGLNQLYGNGGTGPFHLLHRRRRFNPAEGRWMGWERKRGKLEELNRLLLDGGVEDFPVREGDTEALAGTRYVVTLDADTRLPQAAVARLVGTLAHPLNRPIFGEATGRIRSGYSIVQPRVEISPDSGNRSLFSRLFTGDTAIDIYSRAVSDVYQDLFGEGIFVGKGIYDVAAFHRSVDGRVPDNAILSHDLFEGILGRAGLATDIVLYESFPRTYPEYLRRWHRWVRGDWQLLPWLFPRVPAAAGRRIPNRFSAVDRWKIFDNLRRSLVPPGLVAFALSGWFLLPGTPWLWTLLAMLAPAGHIFTDLVTGFARGRRRGSIIGLGGRVADQTGRLFLALTFLPREASTALHAVGAVLWRSTVTRSGLLEWTTAASLAGVGAGRGRATTWREMWHGPAFALAVAVGLALTSPAALPAAGPLLILWWLSPEIALRIARPRRLDAVPPSRNDTLFLRKLGRRTWLYFETFAGPEDNWLPPDNYQEEPFEEIAHRTSPTNIGMMLVASTVALDRGWIGDREFAARTAAAFEALERLERHRGHFLNWYDTQTLAPLEPHYVSTVDSGNLAFCLLVLAAACEERADVTSESQDRRWQGLQDAVLLLAEPTSAVAPAPADPLRQLVSDIQATIVSVLERSGSSNAAAADIADRLCPAIEGRLVSAADGASLAALREAAVWLDRVRHQAEAMRRSERGQEEEVEWRETLKALARRARDWAYGMDFAPLYDRERRLFHIGHNLSAERLDPHHYDLLASEARLASYFAIAKGDVPAEHWFHLGRPLTREGGAAVLLSWNGSMFEYLMPPLFLPSGPETLLAESERAAVELQRRHGKAAGTPWGVSESAYAERDPHQRYRYRAFGVPGLGLKRGLEEDSVVAPYASALALPIAPGAAMANLRALWESGAGGVYGLYEAVDYTPGRAVPRSAEPVRAFMAHHQGMILAAIGNLLDGSVIERVRRDGRIRVADLLLSERVPREIPPEIERFPVRESGGAAPTGPAPGPWTPATGADFPQVHMLGNGRLASWVSGSGGGGLYWRGHAVTRFAPDATCDGDGLWIYVADEVSGGLWSAARQPVRAEADDYRITFHPHCAEIQRRDNGIALRTEIAVAPSEDVEFRRVTIVNETNAPRRLRLTSYGEVVLAPPGADERHPAFSKLFVGAEHRPELNGLLFHRRSRTPGEASPVLVHRLVAGPGVDLTGWEADRRAFLGRGGSVRAPKGLAEGLGGSDGWTLDPIFALQARAELAPFGTCELCFVTAAAGSSESVLDLIERYSSLPAVEWAFSDGAAAAAREVQALGLAPARLPELQQLASLLLHPHPALRAPSETLTANTAGQEQLWSVGISGDLPILLVSAAETAGADETLLGDLVRAMRLWINRGFAVDLVVLGTAASSYAEPAREAVFDLVSRLGAGELIGRRGGIHVVAADQASSGARSALDAAARVRLVADGTPLGVQLARRVHPSPELPSFAAIRASDEAEPGLDHPAQLLFDNGFGGFEEDCYAIHLEPGARTPSPWCNVLANDRFGTILSESGGGFSWAVNSGENRLTSWSNDPVADAPGEMLYVRDEETAEVWTPSPFAAGAATCQVRHGTGWTRWDQRSRGLDQEMLAFVPIDDPVKLVRLRLRNRTERPRRVTATYFAEWVLGAVRSIARPHVVCSYDAERQALLARNPWAAEFSGRIAFLTSDRPAHGVTADRAEFIGREGDLAQPAALRRLGLSNRVRAGDDACAAYQIHLDLAPGGDAEAWFVLGQGADAREVEGLLARWRAPGAAADALTALEADWGGRLGAVHVETPDRALDLMVNRWLPVQAITSRIRARAGFYQAGGAIGFRDQLQDMLLLLHSDPNRVRAHILLCCAHQFEEGDVLHWWHPPVSHGVRTRCSDDLLWLPYVAAAYLHASGDLSLLAETVPFLHAPPLGPDEEDRYARFEPAAEGWPVIEHLERALEKGTTAGAHGLPLIGSGDWNDGMDRVGRGGRGESVWLAWFAAAAVDGFVAIAHAAGEEERARRWATIPGELRAAAEREAWDGAWYRRAYDDEGEPWGSEANEECRIDSISQSWAALAGGERERVAAALASVRRVLIDPERRLVRLLAPPFERTPRDPGYIAAYPPGVRENGGQYSHAAAWLGFAHAAHGDGDAAYEILDLLNPVHLADTREKAELYRIEPYVMAGDVGGAGAVEGRGGWSWYTGAAAWTWRLAVEAVLGLRLIGGGIMVSPCLPAAWAGYSAELRRGGAAIRITVEKPEGLAPACWHMLVNGVRVPENRVDFPAVGETLHVLMRPDPASLSETH